MQQETQGVTFWGAVQGDKRVKEKEKAKKQTEEVRDIHCIAN